MFDEEIHSNSVVGTISSENTNWKPFRIESCPKCGKTPGITRNEKVDGNGRYMIRCCNQLIKGATETEVMVKWNRANYGFVEDSSDGLFT